MRVLAAVVLSLLIMGCCTPRVSEYKKAYDAGKIDYWMYNYLENGPGGYSGYSGDTSHDDMVREQRWTNSILLWNTPMHEMNRK